MSLFKSENKSSSFQGFWITFITICLFTNSVDNSEVINIEQERELRRKNRKLYHSKDEDEENETE